MYDNPISLQELCVDTICCNLHDIFEEYDEQNVESKESNLTLTANLVDSIVNSNKKKEQIKKFRFKQKEFFLYNVISEQILLRLGEKRLLNDSTISIFTETNTRLRHVLLKNVHLLTIKGLKILRQHKVVELDCCGIKININDIIACLSDWSLENIKILNISKCTFLDSLRCSGVVSLTKLRNLRALNVSYTEFPQHGLNIVCEDLKFLERLDISCTIVSDMAPLKALKNTLTSLTIFNYNHVKSRNFVSTLLELTKLKYLDISSETDEIGPEMDSSHVVELLMLNEALPNLTFLDISGKIGLRLDALVGFIKSHQLTYLGLVHCNLCYNEVFCNEKHPDFQPNLVVAGTATEHQITIGLKRYSHRAVYVQKCLYFLFRMTPYFKETRSDIVKLILPGMENHPSQFGVQMAATACLYNLTKGELSLRIHPTLLKQVVSLTLIAMQTFPNHYQLQKNSLLTLCSDRILQDVSFDKFLCARLVMDSLCAFEDQSMNRMAVAICSILAAKISTSETSSLGANATYMKKLLHMVEQKVNQVQVDITMKFTLSALWNLTDESATTCDVFLEEGGIDLFLRVLETFPNDSTVETKVLGLINNIAEVAKLRKQLMIAKFIQQLKRLLRSTHIDVSYFAAGIVSHLALEAGPWGGVGAARGDMLAQLGAAVAAWRPPDQEMVAYRSFKPFFPLLAAHQIQELISRSKRCQERHNTVQGMRLLRSSHIDVSYFAAGIVSHLALEAGPWGGVGAARGDMLAQLGAAVAAWRPPDQEMVAYRSFKPFFPLLAPGTAHQIQLWAVWAVHHVCTKNPKRYCLMLVSEGGVTLLQQILNCEETHPSIQHLAGLVLDVLQQENLQLPTTTTPGSKNVSTPSCNNQTTTNNQDTQQQQQQQQPTTTQQQQVH